MGGARKSNPVAHDIRSVRFDWPDVSGGHLRTPHSVDELQPGDRATLVIGAEHNAAENPVTQDSRDGQANAIALLIEPERRLLLVKIEWSDIVVTPRQ